MSEHTPGPWKWGWDGTGLAGPRTSPTVYLDETDTAEIPIHARGQAVAWVLRSGAETADMKADARLIAAAPDMRQTLGDLAELATAAAISLEWAIATVEPSAAKEDARRLHGALADAVIAARAVIAKAEGKD